MAEKDKKTEKSKTKESTGKLERVYVIPIGREYRKTARWKRTKKSVRAIKEFVQKHMKVEEVKIEQDLNEKLWERGNKKPSPRIKVSVKKEEGKAVVQLFGIKFTEKKEKKKEKKVKEEKKGLEDELGEGKISEKKKEDEEKIKQTQKGRMKNE